MRAHGFPGWTRVRTTGGVRRFDSLPRSFKILNESGWCDAQLVWCEAVNELVLPLGAGVATPCTEVLVDGCFQELGDIMKDVSGKTFTGRLYHMRILKKDDDAGRYFSLANGHVIRGFDDDEDGPGSEDEKIVVDEGEEQKHV